MCSNIPPTDQRPNLLTAGDGHLQNSLSSPPQSQDSFDTGKSLSILKDSCSTALLIGNISGGQTMYFPGCRHMLRDRFSWFNVSLQGGSFSFEPCVTIQGQNSEALQLFVDFLHTPDQYDLIANKVSSFDAAADLYCLMDFYHPSEEPKPADKFAMQFIENLVIKMCGFLKKRGKNGNIDFVDTMPFTADHRTALVETFRALSECDSNGEDEKDREDVTNRSYASLYALDLGLQENKSFKIQDHDDILDLCKRTFTVVGSAGELKHDILERNISFYALKEGFSCFGFLDTKSNRLNLGPTTEKAMNLFIDFLVAPWDYQTILNDKENTWHDICELYKLVRTYTLDPKQQKPHDHYFKGLTDHISTCLTETSIKESNINAKDFIEKLVGLLNNPTWREELQQHNDNVMSKYLNSFFRACPKDFQKKGAMDLWLAACQHGDTLQDFQKQCLNVIERNVHAIDPPKDISEDKLMDIFNSDLLGISSELELLTMITTGWSSRCLSELYPEWLQGKGLLNAVRIENVTGEDLLQLKIWLATTMDRNINDVDKDIEQLRKTINDRDTKRCERPWDIFYVENGQQLLLTWRPGLRKDNISQQNLPYDARSTSTVTLTNDVSIQLTCDANGSDPENMEIRCYPKARYLERTAIDIAWWDEDTGGEVPYKRCRFGTHMGPDGISMLPYFPNVFQDAVRGYDFNHPKGAMMIRITWYS